MKLLAFLLAIWLLATGSFSDDFTNEQERASTVAISNRIAIQKILKKLSDLESDTDNQSAQFTEKLINFDRDFNDSVAYSIGRVPYIDKVHIDQYGPLTEHDKLCIPKKDSDIEKTKNETKTSLQEIIYDINTKFAKIQFKIAQLKVEIGHRISDVNNQVDRCSDQTPAISKHDCLIKDLTMVENALNDAPKTIQSLKADLKAVNETMDFELDKLLKSLKHGLYEDISHYAGCITI